MVIRPGFADTGRAQRGHRDRAGVVRVVLVHVPGGQQPHPRAQLGLHVQHPLAGGQQLLRQQVPQSARPLDRPGPLRPGRGPRQQPLGLRCASAHPQLAQRLFRTADHHRRVRRLVRIDPDHHCCHDRPPLPGTWQDRGGHAYFQDLTALAPLLSHATARSRQASTSFESQARRPAGGYRATPARTSQRYDQAPQPGQAATSSPSLK